MSKPFSFTTTQSGGLQISQGDLLWFFEPEDEEPLRKALNTRHKERTFSKRFYANTVSDSHSWQVREHEDSFDRPVCMVTSGTPEAYAKSIAKHLNKQHRKQAAS